MSEKSRSTHAQGAVCKRAWVTGRVQGVCFRMSTQREAQRLGIDGYAKNLSDGRVEVLMSGAQEDVAQLEIWLQNGPSLARVDDLVIEAHDQVNISGFTTL